MDVRRGCLSSAPPAGSSRQASVNHYRGVRIWGESRRLLGRDESGAGNCDAFLTRFLLNGTLAIRSWGAPSQDAAHDVAVDSTGIYVARVPFGLFVDRSEVFEIRDIDSSGVPGDAFMNVSDTNGAKYCQRFDSGPTPMTFSRPVPATRRRST
jgi:hypothetical protein